jgi:hypothetical protein
VLRACARRLAQRGLRVLVERAVHVREFPQYEAFHPDENGAPPPTFTPSIIVSPAVRVLAAAVMQHCYA